MNHLLYEFKNGLVEVEINGGIRTMTIEEFHKLPLSLYHLEERNSPVIKIDTPTDKMLKELRQERIKVKQEEEITFQLVCSIPERYYRYYERLKKLIADYENLNLRRPSVRVTILYLTAKYLRNKKPLKRFVLPNQGGNTFGAKFTSSELTQIQELMDYWAITDFKTLAICLAEMEGMQAKFERNV